MNYFCKHLSQEEWDAPIDWLERLFVLEIEPEHFKKQVLATIRTACSAQEFGHQQDYDQVRLVLHKMMEAAFQLWQRKELYQKPSDKPSNKDLLFFNLTPFGESVTLHFFLEEVFDYLDLDRWHEVIDEIYYSARQKEVRDDIKTIGCEMTILMGYLENLVNGLYEIYIEYMRS